MSVNWQKEIEAKYTFIDKLYKDYQAEQILLTEEMRKKRENEIVNKEKEAKELQKQRFGYEGELFKKKQVISIGTKYLAAVVAAQNNMLWLAREDESG